MDRFASALLMVFTTASLAPGALAADLTIWWNKGFYPEEDEAFERVVTDFERATGTDIDLALFAIETGPPKMLAALAAHQPPTSRSGSGSGTSSSHAGPMTACSPTSRTSSGRSRTGSPGACSSGSTC